MKDFLKHSWQIKALFTAIWVSLAVFSSFETIDYTRDRSQPWLFFVTLPALLVCLAWSNQHEILKGTVAGTQKYVRWAGFVIYDVLSLTLILLAPLILVGSLAGTGTPYTRKSVNSELILAASSVRNSVTLAADKAGSLTRAGQDIQLPRIDHVDFAQVAQDGLIVLHSKKTDSTLVVVPKMENGKTYWQCHGFPANAFPATCRGGGDTGWLRIEPVVVSCPPEVRCPEPGKK